MRLVTPSSIAAALLFGAVVAIPYFPAGDRAAKQHAFVVELATTQAGHAQLYIDSGRGLSEQESVRRSLADTDVAAIHHFRLPPRQLIALRFDPIDNSGTVQIRAARIEDDSGNIVRHVPLEALVPANQIESAVITDGALRIVPTATAIDPQLNIPLAPALDLRTSAAREWFWFFACASAIAFAVVIVLFAVDRSAGLRARTARIGSWMAGHPHRAIALIAAGAAILSQYPVVLFGKSLTSPNLESPRLLYANIPTLPGYTNQQTENAMGADIGALAWHHHPLSILQHRALFRDFELPLWNRYDNGGVPLLGQGQSMFGDPLHVLPIIANGAAWAWDVKFIGARWLFGWALGFIVWRLTRHRTAALLTAGSAAFIGFFVYRYNHPAIFSMCYAPWILGAWVGLLQARPGRSTVGWAGGLVLASWSVVNSGTAKEAYMLLIGLNATGFLLAVCENRPWGERLNRMGWAAMAGVIFGLISAPVWLTFKDALAKAFTTYNEPAALQILPTMVLGVFDELFYRPIHSGELVWNPSANYLVFGGILFLIATWRRTEPDRARLALALGAGGAFAFAFGIIPPSWIIAVPFLGNVGHIDNTFSCVLIVHLIVLAGFGYRVAAVRLQKSEGRGDLLVATLLGAVPVLAWLAVLQTVHREPFGPGTTKTLLRWGEHMNVKPFVWGSVAVLNLALIGLALTWRRAHRRGAWSAAGALVALACLWILLWRHGQHLTTNFERYVVNPPVRVDFHATSPAIDYTLNHREEAIRVVGLDNNLFPGWSGAYDLESTGGPDAVVSHHYRELIDALGFERRHGWIITATVSRLPAERAGYDFLNVRYLLTLHPIPEEQAAGLRLVLDSDLDVYESPSFWPRAFFTDHIETYHAPAEIGERLKRGDTRPFAMMQVGEGTASQASAAGPAERAVVPATDYHLTSNTTRFSIAAPGPGLAVLHENFWAGDFRVTLNGEPAEVLRVNHAFKGVSIPAAGTYEITFSYWPRRFSLALALAAAGLALAAALAWRAWRTPIAT